MTSITLIQLTIAALVAMIGFTMAEFSMQQGQISIYLSSAAFCDKNTLLNRTFVGPTEGFVATKVVHEMKFDATGYIGYLPSDNSIYVVFRGSDSKRNWMADLLALKTDYLTFPECNCKVHKGFYEAEQNLLPSVLVEVKRLRLKFPNYAVKVTGHSLGAAIAQMISMELVKNDIACSLINFGQPRTGDKTYSAFANTKVPSYRVVHYKDDVPHLPPSFLGYYHTCFEVFEDADGSVRTCDSSCEDPTCSDQFKAKDMNPDDHMTYLGLPISCESVSR